MTYISSDELGDLDEALGATSQVLDAHPDDATLAATLGRLGELFLERFRFTKEPSDREAAITNAQRAVDRTPSDAPEYDSRVATLKLAADSHAILAWVPHIAPVHVLHEHVVEPDAKEHVQPRGIGDLDPRGIVITGDVIRSGTGGITFKPISEDLRTLALYWDRIALAYGNGVGYTDTDEDDIRLRLTGNLSAEDRKVLERAGVLQIERRDIDHPFWEPGGPIGNGRVHGIPVAEYPDLLRARVRLLAEELNSSPGSGLWSTGRVLGGSLTSTLPRTTLDADTLALELTLSLPIPPESLPMEDLLNFREKHAVSLAALRRGIRSLAGSPNANLEELLAEIRLASIEIDRRLSETFVQRWSRRARVVLALNNAAQSAVAAAAGELFGQSLSMPPGAGLGAGLGVSGALQIAQKRLPSEYMLPDRLADFYYVYAVARQFDDQHR